jgi:hypothetical protein
MSTQQLAQIAEGAIKQKKDPLRTIEYAAERWGMKPTGVRALIYNRKIDYIKIGRLVRIPDSVIEQRILEGFVPARKRA